MIINIVYILNYRDNNLNIEFKYYLELCGFLSLFIKWEELIVKNDFFFLILKELIFLK